MRRRMDFPQAGWTSLKQKRWVVICVFTLLFVFWEKESTSNLDVRIPAMETVYTDAIELRARLGMTNVIMDTIRNLSQLEARHVGFLKIHKAASSTLLNIFYRFGNSRGLNILLPAYSNYIRFKKQNILPLKSNQSYDLLCNHVIFDEVQFKKYLPNDTVYIAIVREPLQRLHSAFWYYSKIYNLEYLKHYHSSERPFEAYVQNPYRTEPMRAERSMTNNRMAVDFGFDLRRASTLVQFYSYLSHLGDIFDLVLVSEYFDESIILMRRRLNWPLKDILYISQNKLANKPELNLNQLHLHTTEQFLQFDNILYSHFLDLFKYHLRLQKEDFQIELKYFREINQITSTFCRGDSSAQSLYFRKSTISESFLVTREDCSLMMMPELEFLDMLRSLQKPGGFLNFISSLFP